MKPSIAFLLALLSAPLVAQPPVQTYKWVDERGVTTYGNKPPPGRAAQPVEAERPNTIDTAPVPRSPARPAEPPAAAPPLPSAGIAPIRGMDLDTFVRLQTGMTEGELLTRAGRPDYMALEGTGDRIVKTFYYYPTQSNPYTTAVRVRGGRIDNLQRTRKF